MPSKNYLDHKLDLKKHYVARGAKKSSGDQGKALLEAESKRPISKKDYMEGGDLVNLDDDSKELILESGGLDMSREEQHLVSLVVDKLNQAYSKNTSGANKEAGSEGLPLELEIDDSCNVADGQGNLGGHETSGTAGQNQTNSGQNLGSNTGEADPPADEGKIADQSGQRKKNLVREKKIKKMDNLVKKKGKKDKINNFKWLAFNPAEKREFNYLSEFAKLCGNKKINKKKLGIVPAPRESDDILLKKRPQPSREANPSGGTGVGTVTGGGGQAGQAGQLGASQAT
jgi:hypothetical protein